MKRRILMVSAMILLLGSQVQMFAQKKGGPDHYKRPGMEMHGCSKPGGPMHGKAICQGDIVRLQDLYWKKYRVRLSRKEAENILIKEMRDRDRRDFAHNPPPPPKDRKPQPRGPQGLPRR